MSSQRDNAPPRFFDRDLLARRQRRARSLGAETFLLDRVATDLADRLGAVLRTFSQAADLGSPTGAVGSAIAPLANNMVHIDLPRDDFDALPLAMASLDLVVSALALQFVNDLPGTLAQVRRALKPDGLFLAALAGGDTLTELRQSFAAAESEMEDGLSPRVMPMIEVRDAGALLQRAGFALPVTDVDRIVVRYGDVFALMRDLRRMGATNILNQRRRIPLRRATLFRMAEIYAQRFADDDGRIRATFDIVWMSGWAPHDSQQKPLKPGSGRMSLEQAVKVKPADRK